MKKIALVVRRKIFFLMYTQSSISVDLDNFFIFICLFIYLFIYLSIYYLFIYLILFEICSCQVLKKVHIEHGLGHELNFGSRHSIPDSQNLI